MPFSASHFAVCLGPSLHRSNCRTFTPHLDLGISLVSAKIFGVEFPRILLSPLTLGIQYLGMEVKPDLFWSPVGDFGDFFNSLRGDNVTLGPAFVSTGLIVCS